MSERVFLVLNLALAFYNVGATALINGYALVFLCWTAKVLG
jgi:hypothetical protein